MGIRVRKSWSCWRVFLALLVVGTPAGAADHREAPLLSAGPLAAVDINDLYVFPSPENPDAVVFILTVNSGAGQTTQAAFRHQAKHNLLIDKNGDAKEDARILFDFAAPDADGRQTLKVRSVGLRGMRGQGRTGEDFVVKRDTRVHAGLFDDPFFFDRAGFVGDDGRSLCDAMAADSFARKDVAAIVVEMPLSRLGTDRFGVWARTKALGNQVDRMGLAGINSLLVPEGARNAFNRGKPKNDTVIFFDLIFDALTGIGSDPADAFAVAGFYLPDILTVDLGGAPVYPNGRRLEDDVIDFTLPFLGGDPPPVTDCVDANDKPFRATFPYLAVATGMGVPCLDGDADGFPVLVPADCDPGGVPIDCDDNRDVAYPGAPEACDTRDDDCDGSLVDEFLNTDSDPAPDCVDIDDDNDGSFDDQDCAPTDPAISPNAQELCGTGVDEDCDTLVDEPGCLNP